jgi:hypothetical protein
MRNSNGKRCSTRALNEFLAEMKVEAGDLLMGAVDDRITANCRS